MARAKVVVAFDDGTVAEFNPNRPRLLLDMEKRFGVQSPETHAQIAWMAFHALVTLKGEGDKVKFDDWLDEVDEFITEQATDDDDKGEPGKDPS